MSKKVNILCVLNILVVAVISIYTKQQNSITNSIGNGYIIIGFVILAVYLLLIIALLRAINISRDDLKRSLIVLFFVAGAIFLFVGFFIFFVGDLCLLINYKYHMGEGSWLSYFGSVFGAGITVIGAYIVTSLQSNNDNKKLIKAKCILFLNDLKYINDRVDEYVNELERKKDNQEFYRIRYLNISENWREQVSFLFQNRILENFDVNTFYDYFTDIYFITDKYEEIHELNISELNSEPHQKDGIRKRKNKIKDEINNKYKQINNNKKITEIINKINKGVEKLN